MKRTVTKDSPWWNTPTVSMQQQPTAKPEPTTNRTINHGGAAVGKAARKE